MGNGELGLLATYLQRSIAAIFDVRFSEIVSSVCLSFSRPSAQIILHKRHTTHLDEILLLTSSPLK